MPSDLEIFYVENIVKECRKILKPESEVEAERERRYKQDYSHFDRLCEERKKEMIKNLHPIMTHGRL